MPPTPRRSGRRWSTENAFVPIKNVEQQARLAFTGSAKAFVKAHTAQANPIRGLLGEFGLIIPQRMGYIDTRVPELLEDASNDLPGAFRVLVRLLDQLRELDRQVGELEAQIQAWHCSNDLSRKVAQVPGIGPSPRARWWAPLATQEL